MPELTTGRTDTNADRLLRGGSHPVVAIVAFFAAFLFAALPFVFNTDNALVVVPCVIASFSCSILFMRLLIGELGLVKWIFLGVAAFLCIYAGRQWYLIALLTGGTVFCSFLIDRLIGNFVPLIRVPEH